MSRIFITGGTSQGKSGYAMSFRAHGYHVVDDIYKTVREHVYKADDSICITDADKMAAKIMSELEEDCKDHEKTVFVGTEAGCGIVPADKAGRLLREVNGRLNCMIAASSAKVILMTCGLPQIIKDDPL